MPKYSRTVQIAGQGAQALYDKISAEIDQFLGKAGIPGAQIDRDAGARRVAVEHSMVSLALVCHDNQVQIDGKLSLLAAPFKSKIDEGIDKWVKRSFESH